MRNRHTILCLVNSLEFPQPLSCCSSFDLACLQTISRGMTQPSCGKSWPMTWQRFTNQPWSTKHLCLLLHFLNSIEAVTQIVLCCYFQLQRISVSPTIQATQSNRTRSDLVRRATKTTTSDFRLSFHLVDTRLHWPLYQQSPGDRLASSKTHQPIHHVYRSTQSSTSDNNNIDHPCHVHQTPT